MLSVPLMLFRSGDVTKGALRVRSKAPKLASSEWLSQLFTGFTTHLTTQGEAPRASIPLGSGDTVSTAQEMDSGDDQERPTSSPCPSSSSSSSSSDSSASSSDSSNSSSGSEEEAPPPPVNGGNGGAGDGGDDQKKEKEEDDGNSSDSSSSDSSADDDSDQEEDDGVLIDTDDEKDKVLGVDPTDDDLSESDGSSDLENSYPRLPAAPVDTLIAFRQQAAHKELQLTEKLKKEVIADAKQRQQERRQSQRSKKKKTPPPKRRHSKQSEVSSNRSTLVEKQHKNGSTGTADVKTESAAQHQEMTEDEWMVDCSCGLHEKNYDDGTSMIQCDTCSHWVHAKCADKQPEAVAQEKFLCFRCSWMFDCVCEVRRRPNHDDGQRMVECESCKTWQHTMCVGIPMTEEPADDYRCPRCVKRARRRKSGSKGSGSHERQSKRSHTESSRQYRKKTDASRVVAVDVRAAARSIDTLKTPTRSHRSRRAETRQSPKTERRAPLAQVPPPPVPALSPPSSPPPPPASPPPSGSSRRDRNREHLKRRGGRERERSGTSSHRKNGRQMGSSSSSSRKAHSPSESSKVEHDAPPPAAVTPSPRGKGLMLRGYSPGSARTETSSSQPVDVRPPLPLTPPSSSGHSYSSHNNHGNGGRKRKAGSARDRLAKKLKIKKSSLR